jgi:hypothetical protein
MILLLSLAGRNKHHHHHHHHQMQHQHLVAKFAITRTVTDKGALNLRQDCHQQSSLKPV